MELNYDKDLLKLIKLVAYHARGIKDYYHDLDPAMDISGTPWIKVVLDENDLKDIGLTMSRARVVSGGIYLAQGITSSDLVKYDSDRYSNYDTEVDDEGVTYIKTNTIEIPALPWIDSIVSRMENEQKEYDPQANVITLKLDDSNSISLNEKTGDCKYNNTRSKLALDSRKMKLMHFLFKSKNNTVTYHEISKMFYNSEYNKANHAKAISDVLDDLKRDLGILPKTEDSNPDCFKNEAKTGYRLSLSD